MQVSRTIATLAILTVLAGAVHARTYNIEFAGKVIKCECPSSPEGHTLSWVNQNCKALLKVGGNSQPNVRNIATILGVKPNDKLTLSQKVGLSKEATRSNSQLAQ